MREELESHPISRILRRPFRELFKLFGSQGEQGPIKLLTESNQGLDGLQNDRLEIPQLKFQKKQTREFLRPNTFQLLEFTK